MLSTLATISVGLATYSPKIAIVPPVIIKVMNEKKITSLLVVADKYLNKKNKVLKGIIHIHFLLQNGIK